MTIKYEIIKDAFDVEGIKATLDDGTILLIPTDPANSDYQAYLNKNKPKAALSTPMVIDDPKS